MIIPLKTKDYRQIIRSYISALNPIIKLSPKEREVLYLFLSKYYQMYPDLLDSTINLHIFSTENRKAVWKQMAISENSFNNIILSFRKKKIIETKGTLSPMITMYVKQLKETGRANLTYDFSLDYAEVHP